MLEKLKTILTTAVTPQWLIAVAAVWVLLLLLEFLWHHLRATMQRRIVSLKWRTLTRKGFVLVPEPQEARRRRRIFNHASKHPAVLLILGFVLTGLVGNGLVALQEHRQRQRESIVKSMNELRAAYDDLSVGFADYYYRGRALITLQENGAASDELAGARRAFDAASEKWLERLAADSPTIATLHENATGDYGGLSITEDIKTATELVDDCVASNHPKRDPNSSQYVLECTKKDGVTALSRLLTLSNCMKSFASFMRPDPKLDFSVTGNNSLAKRVSKVLETACDVKRYFETPLEMSLALASAVPAARSPSK
jgi:hypothetical protein